MLYNEITKNNNIIYMLVYFGGVLESLPFLLKNGRRKQISSGTISGLSYIWAPKEQD